MKAIEYSNEHVHILNEDGEEICYLSRNWNRCTAGTDHRPADFDEIEIPKYYDGNKWVTVCEELAELD